MERVMGRSMPWFIAALFFAVTLISCDIQRYEAIESEDGEILIIDKWRGKAFSKQGEQLVELEKMSLANKAEFKQPIEMGSKALSNLPIEVSLRIRYVDGSLLYIVALNPSKDAEREQKEPWDKVIREKRGFLGGGGIAVELNDEFNFTLVSLSIPFNQLVETKSANDKVENFLSGGKIDISLPTYALIQKWNVVYRP